MKLPTKHYKSILFDLDGTLLDSVPIILRAFRQVCEEMRLPFDEPAVRKELGIPLSAQAVMFAGERADEFVDRYLPLYRKRQTAGMRLFPETAEMLAGVKRRGYVTGLVTSKRERGAMQAIELTGISDKFDLVFTAEDVANHKPHPEPILKALKLLDLKPEQALYVGDSLFDVDAASGAGVDVAVVTWGARSREDLLLACPGRVFDAWEEFLAWLTPPTPSP